MNEQGMFHTITQPQVCLSSEVGMVSKGSEVFVIKFELLPVSILIFTGIDVARIFRD